MRLIEHKTALYGIQIFLRTNIDTDVMWPRSDAASSGVKYRNATEFEDTRFRVHRQNAADTRNSLRKFLMSAARTGRSVGARNDD